MTLSSTFRPHQSLKFWRLLRLKLRTQGLFNCLQSLILFQDKAFDETFLWKLSRYSGKIANWPQGWESLQVPKIFNGMKKLEAFLSKQVIKIKSCLYCWRLVWETRQKNTTSIFKKISWGTSGSALTKILLMGFLWNVGSQRNVFQNYKFNWKTPTKNICWF